MITRAARLVLRHRAVLRRLVPLRGPLLLRLPEFRLYVRLDDWVIGARIALRRAYEPHVAREFHALLRPAMRVIDLGANIGYYTMLAAAHVGPVGSVAAFEPDLANGALLARSVAANGFRNVTLFPCAAASATAAVNLLLDDSNGRLVAPGTPGARRAQAVALDQLLGPAHRVDLIKMDIEGAEGLALAGMQRIIAANRPTIISEFSPPALRAVSNMAPAEFLAQLRAPGYDLLVIDRARGLSPRPESDAEVIAHFADSASEHLDLLARPRALR
ncbi:FkbM family methyltransferase [Chloroflexales bacterium ZM16-3]|nr:FkbM family methyltransferase [Chloroflexales bacterium ZM16-3]